MKRARIAWGLALLGVATASTLFLWSRDGSEAEWTTAVPEAKAELIEGLEDLERRYYTEAIAHFEHAIQLDADFVAPKLMMFYFYDPESRRGQELVAQLRGVEMEALNERERFLVGYRLARVDGDSEAASRVLDGFTSENPEDAWGIMTRCDEAWDAEEVEATRECLERLVELYPNWSMALSRLGIVSMADGDFDAAEELFDTARYIAPNQAAPHDALGQLYSLVGRYQEAEEVLVRSIEIKGDFCEARRHLVRLYLVQGRLEEASTEIDRLAATEGCGHLEKKGQICGARARLAYYQGDLDSALEHIGGACIEGPGIANVLLGLHLALEGGRWEQVVALEERLEQAAELYGDQDEYKFYGNFVESQRRHAEGLIAMAARDFDQACDAFGSADEISLYWGMERGLFKLANRHRLALCLDRTRHAVGAAVVYRQIESVNPRYLEDLPKPRVGVLSRFDDVSGAGAD